jgi:hypothetical protein
MTKNAYGIPVSGFNPDPSAYLAMGNYGASLTDPLSPAPAISPDAWGLGGVGQNFNRNVASTTEPNSWMPDWLKGAIGTKEAPGWGGLAVGAGSALMSGFMGMQQYGLAKKQLAESKRQFDMNWGAQRQMVNSQLEDRQRARVASNPGAYQSVGSYMSQNGIK